MSRLTHQTGQRPILVGIVWLVAICSPILGSAQNIPILFGDAAGALLIQVKPGSDPNFEAAMRSLKAALATSKDPRLKQQGDSLRYFRAHEPFGGNILYLVIVEPVVSGANYGFIELMQAVLPQSESKTAMVQFVGSLAEGMGKLTLRPLFDSSLPSSALPLPTPPAPVNTAAFDESIVRPKCAKEWPDDFQMRAYCETQQHEALGKLRGRQMANGDRLTIRNKCAKEWPDDYQMRNYCEEQQLKALQSIGR